MVALGQTFVGMIGIPLATDVRDDVSIEATRQTAAGVVLLGPEHYLFPLGDLEPLGLLDFPGLREFFRPALRDDFLPPFLPLDVDLAGVACLGFPDGPSWENLHSAPLSQHPLFQKAHSFLPLPLGEWALDGERPRLLSLLGLVERFVEALAVKVPANGGHKEVVLSLFRAFFSSVILIQIVGNCLAVLDLIIEQCLKNRFFGHLLDTSKVLIPI